MAFGSVLIVDDDADGLAWVRELLELEGYATFVAVDGADGLAIARRFRPDLILLDLRMPVMDGRAFRREQAHDPDIADIPVVCMSAEPDVAAIARALDAAAYLCKPVDARRLLQTLDAAVDSQWRGPGRTGPIDPGAAGGGSAPDLR